MTDKEINIAAARCAAIRVLAVILIIAMNTVFAFKIGWDVRDWQWWLLSPVLTVFITSVSYTHLRAHET